jgi:hypothetical protein
MAAKKRRKKKVIRSDPETVNRLLRELKEREDRHKPPQIYGTRHYVPGGDAWNPASGGLPSLGKGY